MVTAPDGQPFSTGTAPLGSGVSEPVMRVGVTVGPGLAGRPETEPASPAPGAEARGVGDAQDTATTDTSTHTAASRARLSPSSITPSAWIAAPRAATRRRAGGQQAPARETADHAATEVISAKWISSQGVPPGNRAFRAEAVDLWYSGKAHRHGGNVQAVIRPDGLPLWISPAEPGSVHDITASPSKITRIARAALVLTPYEHGYVK
jgi:hypothetical protein